MIMEFTPVTLLYDICLMSFLIFIAKIIRTKIKLFQRLYIPTALIAGFLGVLGGPFGLNILPFSSQASSYSGILIAVLFATMYLGRQEKASFKEMLDGVGDTFFLNTASEIGQYGVAILFGVFVLGVLFPGIHVCFAMMMPAGFVGGHGTAAAIGSVLESAGWEDALTIGQTFATFGLLLGIFGGILVINFCARKGYTRIIKKISAMPEDMKTGLIHPENRSSMGDNTVSPMSLDPLTWHLALVMVSVGEAYLINSYIVKWFPDISIPIYGLALICGLLVQKILKLCRLEDYVDRRVISRIGSSATDYLVGFGVATINISVVIQYWKPMLLLCLLGTLFVVLFFFVISRKFFRNFWVERGIYIFGWSTGVMSIAVLLLRIVDPEFKSGVLEDSGFAWIFISLIDIACVTFLPVLVLRGYGAAAGAVLTAAAVLCILISKLRYGTAKVKANELHPGEKEVLENL